jgi:hypothetical protein
MNDVPWCSRSPHGQTPCASRNPTLQYLRAPLLTRSIKGCNLGVATYGNVMTSRLTYVLTVLVVASVLLWWAMNW